MNDWERFALWDYERRRLEPPEDDVDPDKEEDLLHHWADFAYDDEQYEKIRQEG